MKITSWFGFALLCLPVGSLTAADKDDPPAKKDLFAKQDWYAGQEGKEQEFVGVLKKIERKGDVGFGRSNPYRLEMDKEVREVYMGGKPELLAAYVGKKIKLVGKAVDMELEGKQYHEIWPARVEFIADDKKDKDSSSSDKPKLLKPTAQATWNVPDLSIAKVQPGVARSDEELVKLTGNKDASTDFAKRFKVDAIDWKKQMVVIVSDGQKPTGGYSVTFDQVEAEGTTLTVRWKIAKPEPVGIVPQIVTNPGLAILVDRFEGDVKFAPPLPKASGSEK